MPTRNPRIKHEDGNVGAETARSRGIGDLHLWVESADGYRHPLYLTVDEGDRLADCLDRLLADLERSKG